MAALNELFEAVVPVIARDGGHVDKFVGDGLLAVFGAPSASPITPTARCAPRSRSPRGSTTAIGDLLQVGIGVNSGRVVAGSIGGAGRLNFSVIGDAVNVAARVEAATRELDEEVLITDVDPRAARRDDRGRAAGPATLKGKDEPVELFAPVASRPPSTARPRRIERPGRLKPAAVRTKSEWDASCAAQPAVVARPLLAVLAAASLPAGGRRAITSNPANDPRLLRKPIERLPLRRRPALPAAARSRGTLALERWLRRHFRGVSWGIMRCEKLGPGQLQPPRRGAGARLAPRRRRRRASGAPPPT